MREYSPHLENIQFEGQFPSLFLLLCHLESHCERNII